MHNMHCHLQWITFTASPCTVRSPLHGLHSITSKNNMHCTTFTDYIVLHPLTWTHCIKLDQIQYRWSTVWPLLDGWFTSTVPHHWITTTVFLYLFHLHCTPRLHWITSKARPYLPCLHCIISTRITYITCTAWTTLGKLLYLPDWPRLCNLK